MGDVIYKYKGGILKGQKLHITQMRDRLSFEKHWHSYYEITYYRKCSGHCVLNGKTYDMTDGCLFLLTPKDFHEIIMDDGSVAEYFVLSFSEQIIDDSFFSAVMKGPFYIRQLPEWTAMQIEQLHRLFSGKSEYRKDYLYHLFNCILIEILEHGSSLSHTASDISPMIRESISLMLSDPTANLSLDTFSRKFNVGTTYFSRLFHQSTGIAFKQYLTLLRIEYAKRLLEEKKLPIIDVGGECGFNTPSQFVRAFKQLTGMTPSAYRASALQEQKK